MTTAHLTQIILKMSFIFLIASPAMALTEKNEVYLFSCEIANHPVYQQIAFKNVKVEDGNNIYEYFVIDAEAGNGSNNEFGEGRHLKFTKTLLSTQNAISDDFVNTFAKDMKMNFQFEGRVYDSEIEIFFDLRNNGKYQTSFRGAGPLFEIFRDEFQEVMADSTQYGQFDFPECTSHPLVNQYLD